MGLFLRQYYATWIEFALSGYALNDKGTRPGINHLHDYESCHDP